MALIIGLIFVIAGIALILVPGALINLWIVISGCVPICLIVGGLLAAVIGITAIKEALDEKVDSGTAPVETDSTPENK